MFGVEPGRFNVLTNCRAGFELMVSVSSAASVLVAPSAEVKLFLAMVLVNVPAVDPVTGTVISQVVPGPATIAPPTRVMTRVPEVAVNAPLQALAGAGDAAIETPTGRVSVNPRLLKAMLPVLVMRMVNRDVCPAMIEFGVKNLVMLAPGRLVREACAACGLVAPLRKSLRRH